VELLMKHAIAFGAGAMAFVVAHVVEAARWADWFHGAFDPWFLNGGRSLAVTLGCVSVASAVAIVIGESTWLPSGLATGGGAWLAMTVVLFLRSAGPGTIFPIVIVVGGVWLLLSSVAGAWAGSVLRRTMARR
jgi:hypothetical protein